MFGSRKNTNTSQPFSALYWKLRKPQHEGQPLSALYWWRPNQHACVLRSSNSKQNKNKQAKQQQQQKQQQKTLILYKY